MKYAERIINSVELQFDPIMDILEFHEMMEAMEMAEEGDEPEPVELTSFEFFIQALSYFEGEAKGKLSSDEQSPCTPVKSSNSRIEINEFPSRNFQVTDRSGVNQTDSN